MRKADRGKILILAAGIAAVILYFGLSLYFRTHFTFRTTWNGNRISCEGADGVRRKITKEMNSYTLRLVLRNDQTGQIRGKDIALTPVFDGEIERLCQKQNAFAWPYYLICPQKLTAGTVVSYDKAKLKQELNSIEELREENWIRPKDARISEYTDGEYHIIEETKGTAFDQAKLAGAVSHAVETLQEELSLEEAGCYKEAAVTKDNRRLIRAVETLNRYVGTTITYDAGEKERKLTGDTIRNWLSVTKLGAVVIDNDKLAAYAKEVAEDFNTAYRRRTLLTSYGKEVEILGGDYGWRVDQKAEMEMIRKDIKAGDSIVRRPVYAQTANSHGEHDYGDTYVEINLTAQYLFFYKDGELIVETQLVSGNPSRGNETPVGAYAVTYKQRNATLRGADYETKVTYWMPYCGDVGMHDAPWRACFGGSIYKKSGSHGCINLPKEAAEIIYENIEAGDPVLVYELADTEGVVPVSR